MVVAVEASSLTSVTTIAANPPLHLANIHSTDLDTLTLYIARVPGSRDVFLTPLKPRDRVVTAEDIQSALYYVHCSSADDVELITRRSQEDGWYAGNESIEQGSPTQAGAPRLLPRTTTASSSAKEPYNAPQLPPRPPQIRRKPIATGSASIFATGQQIHPRRPLPPLPQDQAGQEANPYELTPMPMSPSEAAELENAAGSLTLIRREPVTGEQWNVAVVRDSPGISSGNSNSLTAARATKHGGSLTIDISNPAYFAFEPTVAVDSTSPRSCLEYSTHEQTFSRRLHLPRAMSNDHQSGPHFDMRKAGYCFRSPWNGLCEFTTSSAGRVLICRHSPSNNDHSHDVSELRFNLPSTSTDLTARAQKRQSYVPADKRRSRMDTLRGISHSEGSDFDLDLALGKEMAGGGFGGRQPKLGKLIIHPPGLAMLDLLVAANIGLWWRAWDKVS